MLLSWIALSASAAAATTLPVRLHVRRTIDSPLANVHLEFERAVEGKLDYTYGPCESTSIDSAWQHIASTEGSAANRLIWKLPDKAPSHGCLTAWSRSHAVVGRSAAVEIPHERRKLERATPWSVPMDESSGIDSEGPWFDGVKLLKDNNMTAVDVEQAKSKKIAIIGGGMAGLMIWTSLNMVGMKNLSIIEASQRLGGRVHTEYIGDPSERQYQDKSTASESNRYFTDSTAQMGPMRFPYTIRYEATNETLDFQDHKLVFDFAAEVNKLNDNDPNLAVEFIPWYPNSAGGLQHRINGPRKPDGSVPSLADIEKDPSLAPPRPVQSPEVQEALGKLSAVIFDPEFTKKLSKNMFQAHKEWLNSGLLGEGGENWSEFGYIHNYLKYDLNITDQVLHQLYGGPAASFWDLMSEFNYFGATEMKTIDGGLNRLPSAFHPLVDGVTTMGRKITKLVYSDGKIHLGWKDHPLERKYKTEPYDYAITTVPLAVLRSWQLPAFDVSLSNAIDDMPYMTTCKVGLQFRTRFWEHLPTPIYGSCSTTTDIKGIGQVCYPSYDINSTGPGVMLAQYAPASMGNFFAALSEEEHVAYVLNAMIEIHGEVAAEQYTGKYNRYCWGLDEFETVAWAAASVGARQNWLPAFSRTESNVIVSGEGTSYTSAWIAAALESGVRASVQILLELGLVDEAKVVVDKWMARWITI